MAINYWYMATVNWFIIIVTAGIISVSDAVYESLLLSLFKLLFFCLYSFAHVILMFRSNSRSCFVTAGAWYSTVSPV